MADIIRAVDERLDATQCGGRENCLDEHRCMTHDLWSTLNAKMFEYLASVTLADLVERQKKLALFGEPIVVEDRRRATPRAKAVREVAALA